MRKPFLVVLLSLVVAGTALAAAITINTTAPKTFTDCASGGSAAQTIPAGSTLMRTTTETVWLCFANSASTCVTGGQAFPAGTVILIDIASNQTSVSCRSVSSTGDAYFDPAM